MREFRTGGKRVHDTGGRRLERNVPSEHGVPVNLWADMYVLSAVRRWQMRVTERGCLSLRWIARAHPPPHCTQAEAGRDTLLNTCRSGARLARECQMEVRRLAERINDRFPPPHPSVTAWQWHKPVEAFRQRGRSFERMGSCTLLREWASDLFVFFV